MLQKSNVPLTFKHLANGEIFVLQHDIYCDHVPVCKKTGDNTYSAKFAAIDNRKKKSKIDIDGILYDGAIVLSILSMTDDKIVLQEDTNAESVRTISRNS